VLLDDASRNKCFFRRFECKHVLRLISIRDIFTYCASYLNQIIFLTLALTAKYLFAKINGNSD
jgi:hypothetical protein